MVACMIVYCACTLTYVLDVAYEGLEYTCVCTVVVQCFEVPCPDRDLKSALDHVARNK